MSTTSKQEIFETIRYHYQRSTGKTDKGRLLDQFCALVGWDRKQAIKMLRSHRGAARSASRGGPPGGQRGGPRPRYGALETGVLKSLWMLSGQPCGKRLRPVISSWLASWEQRHGPCPPETRRLLLSMSAAQMDRLLAPFKVRGSTRRPGTLNEVRAQIPLRTGPWTEQGPGWIEADTVAHCGGSLRGLHAWSVVLTDIASCWTEARLSLGRHDLVMRPCVETIENDLPFPILGFDTDNGSEFINNTLLRYWRARQRPVSVTRSRPYRKNDNAHVEQKNRTKVREILGHDRIESPEAVAALNEALRLHSLLDNLYMPAMKLIGKKQLPCGRWRKQYEKTALTPCQRLLAMPGLPADRRSRLEALLAQHDPLTLRETVEARLKEGWTHQRRWSEAQPSETRPAKPARQTPSSPAA